VIHLTTPWNPALLQQATDRVHRRGQQEKVSVHRPIMRDSIEERIEEVIHKKRQLAEAVLGSGEEDLKLEKMSFSDLLQIAGTTEDELKKLKGKKND
jgi:SNF2 family DNA or RNA helicase